MLFDIHSHIIPGVDDGSKSVNESLAIMRELSQQGVDTVLATPHFYASKMSFEGFIEKIITQAEKLFNAAQGLDLPEFFIGSEVYYFKNMSQCADLSRLCINGSKYIMIELPYAPVDDRVIDDINAIVLDQKLTPILAHVERFIPYNNMETLLSFFKHHDIEGQVNAASLSHGMGKAKALSLIRDGYCKFLGSDVHNLTSRPPYMDKAMDYITRKLGACTANKILTWGQDFYNEIS